MKYLKNTVTLQYIPEKCTGCRRCVEVCPHAVFKIENKKAVITDKDRCMECGACAKNCAFSAIQVEAGVGCSAAIINGMLTGKEPSCDCSADSNGNNEVTCC